MYSCNWSLSITAQCGCNQVRQPHERHVRLGRQQDLRQRPRTDTIDERGVRRVSRVSLGRVLIFTFSHVRRFFCRRGPTSRQSESTSDPQIGQQTSKTQFLTHRFSAPFSVSIFEEKRLQKGTPDLGQNNFLFV